MEAVTATRVFEPGSRPDIKDIVLTAYVSVLNFIDFFPFHAKPMKAVNETGVFVNGCNSHIYIYIYIYIK